MDNLLGKIWLIDYYLEKLEKLIEKEYQRLYGEWTNVYGTEKKTLGVLIEKYPDPLYRKGGLKNIQNEWDKVQELRHNDPENENIKKLEKAKANLEKQRLELFREFNPEVASIFDN